MEFQLDQYGYITKYLVSGLKEEADISTVTGDDQLVCEKRMREKIEPIGGPAARESIRIGENSSLGLPWQYGYNYGNCFVDMSKFYPTLKYIQMHAATILKVPFEMEVEVWLWSYAAVAVWLGDELVGTIEHPCYKPIQKKCLKLKLNKGENVLFISLCNLGVRDTRTLFGIQIPGVEKEEIRVVLPDEEHVEAFISVDEWLSSVVLKADKLLFYGKAPEASRVVYDGKPVDFEKFYNRYTFQNIEGQTEVLLQEGKPCFKVEVPVGGQVLSRTFERCELLQPLYTSVGGRQENYERIFKRIASVGQIPRGDKESFSMYPILARYYLGEVRKEDEQEIYKSLKQIESKRDCSDFLTCALVRFLKLYRVSGPLAKRCREVMLDYRYWMDENGSDGMCFWSENHSLMFFVSAYLAGDLYPEERFLRSGKTGVEMKAQAGIRIYDWMTTTLAEGFDEFHSGGYTPITFAAILNVIDFGDEILSELAWKVADRLLEDMSFQTFQGVVIAPMGRVYREVLYPFSQDIQCLVNLIDEKAPDRFSEWIIFLATSRYRVPSDLKQRMNQPLSMVYEESNGRICVERQAEYMLTSVESPRTDGIKRRWENSYGEPDVDKGSFKYVKALNECFHGTTQFEPGVFGYQQHLWSGALSPEAVVFVNHPGGSCESCSTRPGYWFGNGIMPALKQVKNVLYSIYQIPEQYPVSFTHVYWPSKRFREEQRESHWLAASAGQGYIALWCSEEMTPYDDWLAECEYRVHARNTAYLCICGSLKEYSNLEAFLGHCKSKRPVYDKNTGRLTAGNDSLLFEKHDNQIQYI